MIFKKIIASLKKNLTTDMPEIIKFTTENSLFAAPAFEIRRKVFVEEQNVPAEEEFDDYEKTSTHYLAMMDQIPAGTARWRYTENGIKLERFAVLKEYRNQKVGSAILKTVLTDVIPLNQTIYLHAQVQALAFYKRHGFEQVGEMFSECDIDHYVMVLSI
jgi:predicted GNAT family N-acyltransferase